MCSLQDPARVDFTRMAASGVRGVYFKASQYSNVVDSTFSIGVERARNAGLICGAYHFAYCGSDPDAQMKHFWNSAHGLGAMAGELPPMLDWEFSRNLTPQVTVQWLSTALGAITSLWYTDETRLPTIYTYPYYAQQQQPNLANSGLHKYPLTLAAYPNLVTPPKPWSTVTMHQYIGNGGRVPGVATDCDRDRFLGSEQEFQVFLGNNAAHS